MYRINIFFDSAPIVKSDETEKDWLKRIPNKYAFRHANYTYRQALGLYKEISLRDSMRNTKNLSKKEKKIYKEYLHITQLLYQQAKDLYDDVEIRARLAI